MESEIGNGPQVEIYKILLVLQVYNIKNDEVENFEKLVFSMI